MRISSLPCLALLTIVAFGSAVAAPGPAPDPSAAAQDSPLDDPTRLPEDHERDAGSKPLEVFAWLGIEEGMTVGDLVPFSGYNTHLLSRLVGPSGTVYAAFNIPRQQAAFDARMERAGLDNVVIARDLSAVPDGSVDAWVIIRNMHDFYIPSVVEAAQLADGELVMREVLRTLAPGGVLGVVDSRTTAVAGIDPDTHRINPEKVIADLQAQGFEYVDSSELLADPGDDHRAANFPQRWDIDRFLLKFRKSR